MFSKISDRDVFGYPNRYKTVRDAKINYVVTSYANTGGTGDRTAIITASTNIGILDASKLIDGVFGNDTEFGSAYACLGNYIQFDFTEPKCINEIKWYFSAAYAQGTWVIQGYNGVNWVNIGDSFDLTPAAATYTITSIASNKTFYTKYRINGVSGNMDTSPYVREVEFKIS